MVFTQKEKGLAVYQQKNFIFNCENNFKPSFVSFHFQYLFMYWELFSAFTFFTSLLIKIRVILTYPWRINIQKQIILGKKHPPICFILEWNKMIHEMRNGIHIALRYKSNFILICIFTVYRALQCIYND